MHEGRLIQRHLASSWRADPLKAKVFANLIMAGQIHSALWYLNNDDGGGALPLNDDVMRKLKEKRPEAQKAPVGILLFRPIEEVPDVIYQQINAEMVRDAALRTRGSGGPSGIDTNGFRRMLACKSFKRSRTDPCAAVATTARKLCTEYVDLLSIEAILANRLIPLDKGEGAVCPIGVGEVLRRIIGKCVMKVSPMLLTQVTHCKCAQAKKAVVKLPFMPCMIFFTLMKQMLFCLSMPLTLLMP